MGPLQVESIGGKRYVLVFVDDFSRFTWVNFIREKSDTFDVFKDLCTQLQREKDYGIVRIRSDHGTEFENAKFDEYCLGEGIKHEFSSPITPQQNGVVEKKNRTLQESARVMLHAKHLPYRFWVEAMNTTCHIQKMVTLRTGTTTTLYELWKGRKPIVKYFHVFGSKCYILSDRDYRRKMDPKSYEGIFLGYSTNSRAYRVFNSKTETVMESINVVIDDVPKEKVPDVDFDVGTSVQETNAPIQVNESEPENEEIEETEQDQMSTTKGPSIRVQKNHPQHLIIGNPDQGITTSRLVGVITNSCFVSKIKPRNVKEALTDKFWIEAMQEELNQFKRSEVWDLVPRPEGMNVIGTMWIYKIKSDEHGIVTRNKAKLVAQGYTQVKQIEDTIFISQSKYAKNIANKFGLDNGGHKRTPAATHLKLRKDESGISVDQSMYRSMIGSLLYLTASRPDITFVVGVCARYQAELKMSHLTQVKRILKYINSTSDYGILYSYSENFKVIDYCDADWAGSADA